MQTALTGGMTMVAPSASSRRMSAHRRDIEIAHVQAGLQTSGARSYLGDGRMITWQPPRTAGTLIAVDAELAHQPVPPALGRRFGAEDSLDFWRLWTTNEVAAKLLDVPILVWLGRYGLRRHVRGVNTRTLEIDDVVISCGWCLADTRHRPSERAALIRMGPT